MHTLAHPPQESKETQLGKPPAPHVEVFGPHEGPVTQDSLE